MDQTCSSAGYYCLLLSSVALLNKFSVPQKNTYVKIEWCQLKASKDCEKKSRKANSDGLFGEEKYYRNFESGSLRFPDDHVNKKLRTRIPYLKQNFLKLGFPTPNRCYRIMEFPTITLMIGPWTTH